MATEKKAVLIYTDLLFIVKKLVLKDREAKTNNAGELFLHMMEYVNDLNPNPINDIVDLTFEPIKQTFKRDLVKYEVIRQKKREAGLASAEKRRQNEHMSTPVETPQHNTTNPTVIDNGNDSVNVSVSDVLLKKEPKEIFSFKNSLIAFGFEQNLVEDWLKVRKTKKATNTQTAFKKFVEQVLKTNATYDEVLELCIERSWSGYKSEWFEKEKSSAEKEKPLAGRMTETAIKNSINAFI